MKRTRRLFDALGVGLATYGAVKSISTYSHLRNYSIEMLLARPGTESYAMEVHNSPETITMYIMTMLAGFFLILLGSEIYNRLDAGSTTKASSQPDHQ